MNIKVEGIRSKENLIGWGTNASDSSEYISAEVDVLPLMSSSSLVRKKVSLLGKENVNMFQVLCMMKL